MKEKLEIAEKSLLLSIPYLIVLSLAYYWGYWGYFNIDAVSYYGVQDLIKGFAYTLPSVFAIGVILLIGNKLLDFFIDTARKRFTKTIFHIISSIPFIIFLALIFTGTLPDTIGNWIGTAVLVMVILTVFEGISRGIIGHWTWAADNSMLFFLLKWFIFFGVIFFIVAYYYGQHKAQNIFEDKSFSYSKIKTSTDSATSSTILKYLGKAGDYYLFISPDNKAQHIISIGKVPNLVLYNYDKDDTISIRVYRSLTAKSPKQNLKISPSR